MGRVRRRYDSRFSNTATGRTNGCVYKFACAHVLHATGVALEDGQLGTGLRKIIISLPSERGPRGESGRKTVAWRRLG